MKKIKLIARERIINPSTGKCHSDEGLMALNSYYETAPFEVDDDYNSTTIVLKFEEKHPECYSWSYQIIELD